MSKRRASLPIPVLLCLVLLAGGAIPQPCGIGNSLDRTGRVIPLVCPGCPSICLQFWSHEVDDGAGGPLLRLVDNPLGQLGPVVGSYARLVGTNTGVTCEIYSIGNVLPPQASLSRIGSPAPGSTVTLSLEGPLGGADPFGLFASPLPGSTVIPGLGTVGIDIATAFPVVTGATSAPCGDASTPIGIPNDPSLSGATAHFQALVLGTLTAPVTPMLSNALAVTVL
jgi:hypothetical protein